LLDRVIKWLLLALGALLVFLAGHLLASADLRGPVQPAPPAPLRIEPEPEPGKLEASPNDLATKRVKTFIVRPEDPDSAPRNR
jgi:hypothetical protein